MSDAYDRRFPKVTDRALDELRKRIDVKIENTLEPWCHEATRDKHSTSSGALTPVDLGKRLTATSDAASDLGRHELAKQARSVQRELEDLDLLHNNFSKAAMRELKRAAPGRLKLHLEYGADEDGQDGMAESERTVSRAARASMGERVQIAE